MSTRVFYSSLSILVVGLIIFAAVFTRELREQSILNTAADAAAVEQILVDQCEETNRTRALTVAQFEYLLQLFRPNDPRTDVFMGFVRDANDPVSCNPDDRYFGIDATPPSREALPN